MKPLQRDKAWTYADAIDAVILRDRAEADKSEHVPRFYVSSFGCCHRSMVLARAGVEGRPIDANDRRNFDERQMVHDDKVVKLKAAGVCVAGETGSAWTKDKQSTRLTDAFPEGFGCRADAVCHRGCDCDTGQLPLTMLWGRMVNFWPEPRAIAARAILAKHELELVEIKTAHANIMNYASTLPRPHNVLQARAAAWAIRRKYELDLIPWLLYFGVGSSAAPLEFRCGGGPEDDYEDVEREITSLQEQWDIYQREEILPVQKPLTTKDKKEKDQRVVFLVADWECSPGYCRYCVSDDDEYGCCEPNLPQNVTGDRIGYADPEGLTLVQKWLDKVPGWNKVVSPHMETIDQPRTKE